MKNEKQYIKLTAGVVRREGDEQRDFRHDGSSIRCWWPFRSNNILPNEWKSVALVDHRILAADLCHLEFRRSL